MASPAPGTVPAPPISGPGPRLVARRREGNANPLVQKQRRPRAPAGARPPVPSRPPGPPATAAPVPAKPISMSEDVTPDTEPDGEWQEYKLTTTKAALLKGLRHSVMRMQSKREVNPLNPDQFTRPVRLHRRDPRAPLQGAKEEAAANMLAAANKAAEAQDKAKDEAEQAKRDAEKQANLDRIAPFGGAQKQKKTAFQKKTQQVFKSNDAEKRLRYEEFFPWFIEDFDNKNTWQGQLESSLSKGVFAMFVLDDGSFRMVPIQKWYKFQEKNRFPTMTSEEAEIEMKKNARPPRWLMDKTEEKDRQKRMLEENARAQKTVFTRKGDRLKGEAEADDLDFEDDQFADDEEAPIMEGEEQENKEIEKRIKKEQLSANFFDARDERDYEKEEQERKKLDEVRRKHGKKVRKALMAREGNHTYETDSDDNPYGAPDEESEDEEEASRKQEEKRKEDERRKAEQAEKEKAEKERSKTPPVSAPASVPAPTTTVVVPVESKPRASLAKKEKMAGTTSLPATGEKKPSLKRAGSPRPSESGTESRKKPKKTQKALATSTLTIVPDKKNIVKLKVPGENLSQIASSTPSPSPPAHQPPPQRKRKAEVPGGGGDERSGEMTDGPGSKKQRIKLVAGGRVLSPPLPAAGSRHETPASRAGSPAVAGVAVKGTLGPPDFITDQEIKLVLNSNPEGVTLKFIADKFKNRVKNDEVKKGLVSSLRRLSVTTDKRTYRLKEEEQSI